MGNKVSKNEQRLQYNGVGIRRSENKPAIGNSTDFRWSMANTKMVPLSLSFGKADLCALAIKRVSGMVMIVAVNEEGNMFIRRVKITADKKNRLQLRMLCKHPQKIKSDSDFDKSKMSPMVVAISKTGKYIASTLNIGQGAADRTAVILCQSDAGHYVRHMVLPLQHRCLISQIRFVEHGVDGENILLTSSEDGTVCLWDFNYNYVYDPYQSHQFPLLTITDAADDDSSSDDVRQGIGGRILGMDHVYVDDMHIVAFCGASKTVVVREIHHPQLAQEDDGEAKPSIARETYFIPQRLGEDVNCVRFSPNGDFLAATSCDGTYEIYAKCYRVDSFLWNIKVLEWRMVCSQSFDVLVRYQGYHGAGVSLTWADNHTLMVGHDSTTVLYCTHVVAQQGDEIFLVALMEGVQLVLESLPHMNWLGFVYHISKEVMNFFEDYDVFHYQYKVCNQSTSFRNIASCKYGSEENQQVVMFGCSHEGCKAIIPQ